MGQLAVLLSLFVGLAAFTDLPDKMLAVYNESVAAGQQLATAGDLRSMSVMLDYHYLQRGRYPRQDHFASWLSGTFKENNLKELSLDHWDNRYIYSVGENQQSYVLVSPGPDGLEGSPDDMKVTGP